MPVTGARPLGGRPLERVGKWSVPLQPSSRSTSDNKQTSGEGAEGGDDDREREAEVFKFACDKSVKIGRSFEFAWE